MGGILFQVMGRLIRRYWGRRSQEFQLLEQAISRLSHLTSTLIVNNWSVISVPRNFYGQIAMTAYARLTHLFLWDQIASSMILK